MSDLKEKFKAKRRESQLIRIETLRKQVDSKKLSDNPADMFEAEITRIMGDEANESDDSAKVEQKSPEQSKTKIEKPKEFSEDPKLKR